MIKIAFGRVAIDLIGPLKLVTENRSRYVLTMGEMNRLLSNIQLITTLYHPISNGLVERFNGTLKQMFKHVRRTDNLSTCCCLRTDKLTRRAQGFLC